MSDLLLKCHTYDLNCEPVVEQCTAAGIKSDGRYTHSQRTFKAFGAFKSGIHDAYKKKLSSACSGGVSDDSDVQRPPTTLLSYTILRAHATLMCTDLYTNWVSVQFGHPNQATEDSACRCRYGSKVDDLIIEMTVSPRSADRGQKHDIRRLTYTPTPMYKHRDRSDTRWEWLMWT